MIMYHPISIQHDCYINSQFSPKVISFILYIFKFLISSFGLWAFNVHPTTDITIYFITGLAITFEGACQNCLYVSKKLFGVPLGSLKNKIRSCGLTYLLLTTLVLLLLLLLLLLRILQFYCIVTS